MYYMVLALLFKTGIKCENHSGGMMLLEICMVSTIAG